MKIFDKFSKTKESKTKEDIKNNDNNEIYDIDELKNNIIKYLIKMKLSDKMADTIIRNIVIGNISI